MAREMARHTVEARKRPCPTCGAKVGAACERKRDGFGKMYRANYSHKTRFGDYRPKHCASCACFNVDRGA